MTERKDSSIPRFYEAVKLIAVTQVSSAAAERVFFSNSFSSAGQLVIKLYKI